MGSARIAECQQRFHFPAARLAVRFGSFVDDALRELATNLADYIHLRELAQRRVAAGHGRTTHEDHALPGAFFQSVHHRFQRAPAIGRRAGRREVVNFVHHQGKQRSVHQAQDAPEGLVSGDN